VKNECERFLFVSTEHQPFQRYCSDRQEGSETQTGFQHHEIHSHNPIQDEKFEIATAKTPEEVKQLGQGVFVILTR